MDQTHTKFRCPRFLLNDVVRLWRTFAVDYAAKKWQQANDKWAMRNAKLRIPRELTFVKGMLLCIDCELFPSDELWITAGSNNDDLEAELLDERLLEGCFILTQLAPLDAIARICNKLRCDDVARRAFGSYDAYLTLIDDREKREHLSKDVDFERAHEDHVIKEVREISHEFGNALERLFFDQNESLTALTRKYGVF